MGVPSRDGAIRDWRGRVLTRLSAADLRRRTGEGRGRRPPGRPRRPAARRRRAGTRPARRPVRVGRAGRIGVTARFADGTSAAGDLLVGADGLHSVVRGHLLGRHPPAYAGYTAWRGVAAFDLGPTPPGETWGRGARFGLVPLAGGRVYWFATANAPEGVRPADGDHRRELLDRFRGWHEPVEAVVRATDPSVVLRNDIYDRDPVNRWGDGRATLLGDAAHPTTPEPRPRGVPGAGGRRRAGPLPARRERQQAAAAAPLTCRRHCGRTRLAASRGRPGSCSAPAGSAGSASGSARPPAGSATGWSPPRRPRSNCVRWRVW
jgi:hypothetical protein